MHWILLLVLNFSDKEISFHQTKKECNTKLEKEKVKHPKNKYQCLYLSRI